VDTAENADNGDVMSSRILKQSGLKIRNEIKVLWSVINKNPSLFFVDLFGNYPFSLSKSFSQNIHKHTFLHMHANFHKINMRHLLIHFIVSD